MNRVIPSPQSHLTEALNTLDSASHAILELRYALDHHTAEIAEMLGCAPEAVDDLLEQGVQHLIQALDVDSLDGGVALILALGELPRDAWGGRSTETVVEVARHEVNRRHMSGPGSR
jgi:hypothetical protein